MVKTKPKRKPPIKPISLQQVQHCPATKAGNVTKPRAKPNPTKADEDDEPPPLIERPSSGRPPSRCNVVWEWKQAPVNAVQQSKTKKKCQPKSKKPAPTQQLNGLSVPPKAVGNNAMMGSFPRPIGGPVRPPRLISGNEVLQEGLVLAGVDVKCQSRATRATNVTRFKAEYGSDPEVYARIFNDLQTATNDEAKMDGWKVPLAGFFIATHFLKRYQTEMEQANKFGMSRNTIRKWKWFFVNRIRALKAEKIYWPPEWRANPPAGVVVPILLLTVDGVHFRITEPFHERYNKNSKFYSHKFKTSALNYEIGIHLSESHVVHIRGPYCAALPDITIF